MKISPALLQDAKDYLCITWDDDAGDKKLAGILTRGMTYLNNKVGKRLNYTIEDTPRQLLFDFCRYARSNAIEDFENNFLHELLSLQNIMEARAYVKKQKSGV